MSSIVPGFEYDIFISYRHNDNRSGWVTEFVKSLQEELAATIKEPVSIYFDTNPHDGLLETHNVDKSLEGKLNCLIFIPIISQTYCDTNSFAWQHEFVAFNKLAKEDQFGRDIKLNNGNVASRILPIKIHELENTDKALLENELKSPLRAIEFIYKSSGVNRPLMPADSPEKTINKSFYRDQINKMANGVKEILAGLKEADNPSNVKTQVRSSQTKPQLKIDYVKSAKVGAIVLILGLVAGYFILSVVDTISLSNQEQEPLHKIIFPFSIIAIVVVVARQPARKMGFSLMQIVAAACFIGGLMDLLFTFTGSALPDPHLRYLKMDANNVSNQLVSLEFSLLRALGTALLAVAIGAWVMLAGPIKQGSKIALAAFVLMMTLAEGNNAIQLYTLDSPFYIYPVTFVLMTWIGAMLWWKGDPNLLQPSSTDE